MQPIKLELSSDQTLTLAIKSGSTELSAAGVDDLIRRLAAHRAKMTPINPAEPPADPAKRHASDNLLWSVEPSPHRPAIEFAMQHPGLGWSVMTLSRAQAEDLQTSIEFALAKLPESP